MSEMKMSDRYLISSNNDDEMHPDGYHRVFDSKMCSIVAIIDDYALAKGLKKKLNTHDSLVEEVERLRKDRAGAVKQMSKSWRHNHENQSDLLTRYVEMANAQFEIMERLRIERDELLAKVKGEVR